MGGLALASPGVKAQIFPPSGYGESFTFRSAKAKVMAAFSWHPLVFVWDG